MTGSLKDGPCSSRAHAEARPGKGSCPLCGRPRCSARAKSRPGERCRRNPVPGGKTCNVHGSNTRSARAAGEQRQQEEAAAEALKKMLWVGIGRAAPVTDPVALLAQIAGALQEMTDRVGTRVNELQGRVAAGEHMSQLRAEVLLFEKLLGHLRGVTTDMARLGIAERHVELEQEKAQLVTTAFMAALAAVTLVPADRDLMLRSFLQALGRGPDPLELTGEAP